MAERVVFIPEASSEDTEDSKEKKSKKKSKKASIHLGASVIGTEKAAEKTEARSDAKPEGWDKLLADLALEKEPKEKEKTRAEFSFADTLEKTGEKEAKDTAEIPEFELAHELQTNQLSGGEVIINLRNSVEETVELPLDTVEKGAEQPAEPSIAPALEIPNLPTEIVPKELPSPPLAGAGGHGGSGGGTPILRGTPSSPFPRRRPGGNPGFTPGANTVTAPPAATNFNQLLTNQQTADEAWTLGRRRGHGEGVLAGLIVGGGIEHFRHKSREKKMEKKAKQERRKRDNTIENTEFQAAELEKGRTETIRKADTKQRLQEENLGIFQRSEAAATARALTAEKERADTEKSKAELIERLNAQAAEQERHAAEERLKNPENRIETSAWHAIEVDKSGHAVQDTGIEYGHEYYHERAQETGPREDVDVKAGGAALAAITDTSGSTAAQPAGGVSTHPEAAQSQSVSSAPTPIPKSSDRSVGIPPATNALASLVPWLILLVLIGLLIVFLG